ncbi:MAG TPA: MotA/TolQ/ExbB proton channel family protein [Isosphaeraceae bacterium]|nr:MotA/TolQ/ExbB proton channel family protein [Isosphaeraceae bacterium]
MLLAKGARPAVAAAALALMVWVVAAEARGQGADAPPAGNEPAAAAVRVDPNESIFRWGARASGPIGLVILGLSFYLVALVVWMSFEYRRSVAIPDPLARELGDLLRLKSYSEAYQRLTADRSLLARTLAAGVRKLPSGLPPAIRAMEMANDDATMAMEHRTTYLSTVGTLGPMIGLVGTVYGMIISFRVMATTGTPQASQLAGGISTALFATLEGIALSIPAISSYAFFRNRIARLSIEAQIAAESLLEQFAPGVRPSHPLVNAPPAGPARPAIGGPKEG